MRTTTAKTKPNKSCMKVLTQEESLNPSRRKKTTDEKQVSWDTIEIREYKRTVGDNPSCSSGPPLAIEWEYDPEPVVVNVEEFEEYRPPRRTQFELMLGRDERHEILEDEWQIPQEEIAQAIRLNIKAKNQRLRTLNNIGRISEIEEKFESVKSKLKKRVKPWKKRSSKGAQELVQQASTAAQQRLAKKDSTSCTNSISMLNHHTEGMRKSEGYIDTTSATA